VKDKFHESICAEGMSKSVKNNFHESICAEGMSKKVKRVLIILPNLDLGGMEVVVMNYFRNINRNKLMFDFVVHHKPGYFEEEARTLGAKIYRVPTRSAGFFKNFAAMRKIYAEGKHDVVIVCTEHSFAFIELFTAWLSGVKTRVAWSHFSDYQGDSRLKRQANIFARPLLRLFTNVFFACTEDAGRWLFGKYFGKNLHKMNFHIINNAIDLKKFAFDFALREKKREELKLGNNFAIGIAGRLMGVKNHNFALETFAKLHAIEKDSTLLIIGDGELRRTLEGQAKRLGISKNVIFTGAVGNINEYYQALDLLLIPSFHEGLTLVAVEAQACGLPVLLSNTVSAATKISDTAYFKSLHDGAASWAEKILSFRPHQRATADLSGSGFEISTEAEKFYNIFSTPPGG